MSSTSYETPLRLEPQVSLLFLITVGLVHLGAVVIAFLLPLAWYLKLIMALFALGTGLYALRQHVFRSNKACVKFVVNQPGGEWIVTLSRGDKRRAELMDDTFVSRWLVVLNFRRLDRKKASLLILPGMLEKDIFRQLRVRLLLAKPNNS